MDIDPRDRAFEPYGLQQAARRTSNSYSIARDDDEKTKSRRDFLHSQDDKGRKRKLHSTDMSISPSTRNRRRRRSSGAARGRRMKEISPSHADSSPHPIKNNHNHKPTTNTAIHPINDIQTIAATIQQPPFNYHHHHLPPNYQQPQQQIADADYHSNDENLANFIDINSNIDAISDNISHAGSRNNNNSNHSGGGTVASYAGRLAWNCRRGDYKPMLASGPRCIDKAVEIIMRASEFLLQDIGCCTQLLAQTAFRDRSLGDHIALYFSTREHQLVATYLQRVTPTMVELAVVSSSDPSKVAGALVASAREGRSARMMAVGREGLCRAVVACAYARLGLSEDRIDFRLMFSKISGGEKGRRVGGGGEGDTIVLTLLMEQV